MLRRLTTAEAVLKASGHDAYVRVTWSLLRSPLVAFSTAGATAWVAMDASEQRPYLECVGEPAVAARIVAAALPEVPAADVSSGPRATVPRGTPALLAAHGLVLPDAQDWDFRWTARMPPVIAGEEHVRWLPAGDGADVAALLAAASPTASARPGDAHVHRWAGVRRDGELVAVVADTSTSATSGLLASVAVHPDGRRHGLGTVVVAWLTRRLLEQGCRLVGLGMYADNQDGRRLYDRLGFADEHHFTSGAVVAA